MVEHDAGNRQDNYQNDGDESDAAMPEECRKALGFSPGH
jgi:hypothetical protein